MILKGLFGSSILTYCHYYILAKRNNLHRFQLQGAGTNTMVEETNTTEIASKISRSSFVSFSQALLVAARHFQFKVFTNPSQAKKKHKIKYIACIYI